MILDLAELSGKNLFRRGKRSWLTIIGIIIGITAIVALFSLGQGLEDSVTQEFEDLGANVIYVLPGSGIQGLVGGQVEEGLELTDRDMDAVKRARGVETAGPMIYASIEAEYRGDRNRMAFMGIPTDESQEAVMRVNNLQIDSGRNLRSTDINAGLVGSNIGEVFEREPGLRSQINVRGSDIRVIGMLEGTGDPEYDRGLFVPVETARDILGDPDRTDFIVAVPQDGMDPQTVAESIEDEIRQERNIREGEENFTVSTADDLLESFLGILGTVQWVVFGIVSIALFVGGLGIMNTMYMSVSERTKEIGVMKALGATKKQILSIYLVEAGVIGLIGGAIGIAVGLGISEVAFYFIREFAAIPLYPSRSPLLIGGALAGSFVLGVLSGYFPAKKAAELEPVEAIRKK